MGAPPFLFRCRGSARASERKTNEATTPLPKSISTTTVQQPQLSLFPFLLKKKPNYQSETHFQKWRSETKTRVKRLQRYRDQARAWLADAEAGSTDLCAPVSVFSDLRRAVETEMERVMEWESALKKRDFSNVALEAAARADALSTAQAKTNPGGGSSEGGGVGGASGVGGGDLPLPSEHRIGRTRTTLLAAVLGGRHGETPQERARRRSCKWIVAAQAS